MKKSLFIKAMSLMLALLTVFTAVPMLQGVSAEAYTGIMHQTEDVYLNHRYDGGSLYETGSGIFALVNAVGYLTGTKMDVVAVANWAHGKGYYNGLIGTYGNVFYHSASQEYGPVYGFHIDTNGGSGYQGSIYDVTIKEHLMAGGTVVAYIENHYLSLVGYNSNTGMYHVYDSTPGTLEDTSMATGDVWVTEEQLAEDDDAVRWYCLVYPAPVDDEQPVISDIKVTDVTFSGYTVTCTVTDNHLVEKVAFPTWTLLNGQDDLAADFMNTQLGTRNGNTFTFRVKANAHNNEAGVYVTHIYAVDKKGNTAIATTGNVQVPVDEQKPVISDVEYTEVSAQGYTVSCTVEDNWEVTKVAFPTWTTHNGQDDLKADWWNTQQGTKNGNRYTFRVKASDHNYETDGYVTHIYAVDPAGNVATVNLSSVKVMNDDQKPVISQAVITNVTSESYTVTCKVTDNWGVYRVAFPTWTVKNGQDDLAGDFMNTQRGTRNGDTFTFEVKITDHNSENDYYLTHIYAEDSAGNVTSISLDEIELGYTETWLERACFDPVIYRARNKDLANIPDWKLKEHWRHNGIREGRTASVILDLAYYRENNSDLKQQYGSDYTAIYTHFITEGYKEYRKSSPAFDASYYVATHSDVKKNYGDEYLRHYVETGMAEGRRASQSFAPDYYWVLKPELAKEYPGDYAMCVRDYIAYGVPQGITAYDNVKPVITNAVISDITKAGYKVTCTVTDNWTVEKVAFPTWTLLNDQDDLAGDFMNTQLGTKNGNTYTFYVKASDHNNEGGMYVTHIYAVDREGNRTSLNLEPVEVKDGLSLKAGTSCKIESKLLVNVKPGTKVSVLVKQFKDEGLEVRDKDGNVISGSTAVTTGCTVCMYKNGKVFDTLTVAVCGDVNGDGAVDTTDYMRVKAAFLGRLNLTDAERRAADVDASKAIDTTDYVRIKAYLLGIFSLYG